MSGSELIISLRRYVTSIEPGDIIEMIILAVVIYHIMVWVKTTRAWALLKGLAVLVLFWGLASVFKMHTILWLGQNVIGFLVMALLIVLQPELRKALEELGKNNILNSVMTFDSNRSEGERFDEQTINEITKACVEMSKALTGALIVITQKEDLTEYERTGIKVDGLVTSALLINIFEHNTPLHDGAVVVKGNRVTWATCYLPLSANSELSKEMGTRHRAGVGISEVADSITVIVSEQTGKISLALNGKLERNLTGDSLKNRLMELTNLKDDDAKKRKRKGLVRR